MDRTERFYRIDRLLRDRGCVPLEILLHEIGISRATMLRDLSYMRDRLHAPIVFDRAQSGYRLLEDRGRYALPGLWFNPSEIHALLTMQHLLGELEPGLLLPHIAPLERRFRALLGEGGFASAEVMQRVKLVPAAKRSHRGAFFEVVASALLARKRLQVRHFNRNSGETSTREISPQRLVYYRDNWYLDSWCHLREDLRSFAVDAFLAAMALPEAAREVDNNAIAARFDGGYGIFSHPSATLQWATLRFSAWRSRWVEVERWHPQQRLRKLDTGEVELEVPFHDPRELLGDILRYGQHCQVIAPAALREAFPCRGSGDGAPVSRERRRRGPLRHHQKTPNNPP